MSEKPSKPNKGKPTNEVPFNAAMRPDYTKKEKGRPSILWGFISGIIGLFLAGVLVFTINDFSDMQNFFVGILLSLSAAGFSLCFTGYLKLNYKIPGGGAIEAGGAVAIFLLVFKFFPAFVHLPTNPYKVISTTDIVDLRNWRPYKSEERKTVPVHRLITENVVRNSRNVTLDYKVQASTSNIADGLDINPISKNLSSVELLYTSEIGRRSYEVDISNSQFQTKDSLTASYEIVYWNCHKLDSAQYKKNDITCSFPYPTDSYILRVLLPKNYSWRSIALSSTYGYIKGKVIEIPVNEGDSIFEYKEINIPAASKLIFFFNGFYVKNYQ